MPKPRSGKACPLTFLFPLLPCTSCAVLFPPVLFAINIMPALIGASKLHLSDGRA
jgi:hypothetical protein